MYERNDEIADREIVASRIFDTPREIAFEAWTNVKHITQWWGPKGFTNTTTEMDVIPGGAWRSTMHGPDGKNSSQLVTYNEVIRPEKLVFSQGVDSEAPFRVTVSFEAKENKTKIVMRMLFDTIEQKNRAAREFGAIEGQKQTMERLADYYKIMPSERQVLITRLYQAPRTLVYKAWSKPEALALWYAPYGCTVQFERLDFKVGGDFLARLHDPKSGDSWTTGTYLEIQAPERLSYTRTTCENEGTPIDPAGGGGGGSGINTEWPQTTTVTTTFEERHGKTKVTLHQTVREELALRTGAHSNWQQMLDRLAKNLRQIN